MFLVCVTPTGARNNKMFHQDICQVNLETENGEKKNMINSLEFKK